MSYKYNRRRISYEQWCKRNNTDTALGKRAVAEVAHGYDPQLDRLRRYKNMLNREARMRWASGQVRDLPENPERFRPAKPEETLDLLEEDHIWPICDGGGWEIENTRLLRKSKNRSEHTRSAEEINRLLRIHKAVIQKFLSTGYYDYYE